MEVRRGEIWYVAKEDVIGSEQKGGRPAIIVSNNANNRHSKVDEVVFLTTGKKKDLPTHVTIRSSGRESIALCEQITSIATERFCGYKGTATKEEMDRIEYAMMISLGVNVAARGEARR